MQKAFQHHDRRRKAQAADITQIFSGKRGGPRLNVTKRDTVVVYGVILVTPIYTPLMTALTAKNGSCVIEPLGQGVNTDEIVRSLLRKHQPLYKIDRQPAMVSGSCTLGLPFRAVVVPVSRELVWKWVKKKQAG